MLLALLAEFSESISISELCDTQAVCSSFRIRSNQSLYSPQEGSSSASLPRPVWCTEVRGSRPAQKETSTEKRDAVEKCEKINIITSDGFSTQPCW